MDIQNLTSTQRSEIMDQVKEQMFIANAQQLLQSMSEKCFKKCINQPGSVLDKSEQRCIVMCMDRFMDSWNVISRAYSQRLKREM